MSRLYQRKGLCPHWAGSYLKCAGQFTGWLVGWLVGLLAGNRDELEKCRDHDGLSRQPPEQVTSSHIVMIQQSYLCDGLNPLSIRLRILFAMSWTTRPCLLIEQLCLELILQLGNLELTALDLMPVLRLLVFDLGDLLDQIIPL